MKKNMPIICLATLNIMLLLLLGRMAWLNMMWKNEDLNMSSFAAKVWATNDIQKGKNVKLHLKIDEEATVDVSKPIEIENGFVVREWIGYPDPFSVLGGKDSEVRRSTLPRQ